MANFTGALLFLLAFISGTRMMMVEVNGACEYLSTVTGGCPNQQACRQACVSCYRGVGEIVPSCEYSGLVPMWECRCYFQKGAPCPPPAGPLPCPDPGHVTEKTNH